MHLHKILELDTANNSLRRNSYYLLATNLNNLAMGFVFWMLIARFYEVNEVGLALSLISASGLITNITRFGLAESIVRFLSTKEDKAKFINTAITLISIFTIIFSVIFLIGIDTWANKLSFVRHSLFYVLLFICVTYMSSISLLLNNIFVAYRESKYVFFQNSIMAVLKIALPIILVTKSGFLGIITSMAFSMMVAVLVSIFIFMPRIQPGFFIYPLMDRKIINEIANFSAANYIVGLIASAPNFLIPIMVLQVLSPAESAYFYISFSISCVLFAISGAYSTAFFSEGSFDKNNLIIKMRKAIKSTYFLLIPLVILTILLSDKLLLLFGRSYSANGHLLTSVFAISSLLIVPSDFYNSYLRVTLSLKELQLITLVISIGIITISYGLLPELGIFSIGIAYIIVYFITALYIVSKVAKEI